MTEKRPTTADIEQLSEYDRFLLDALLQQAAKEAGKPLSLASRRELTERFVEEHPQVKKTQSTARRKATMSRKMRDIQAQAKTDFQWQPPATTRRSKR
ncbi:MAG: hypothetical protein ACRDCA_08770 [Serratia sp. (in: enterobacteria)]|uniref:hypothetical protein n=1 Tax=Serratia sp. (in: enterobacteria) TaxID=616 RepID=UPI003F38AC26